VENALALVSGAIGGGLLSALVTWRMLRENTARELLSEALAIQACMEAWILEGPNYSRLKLSENKGLPTEPEDNSLWLRKVEVRFVLDDSKWNSPKAQYYGLIEGRRTWIVRNEVLDYPPTHTGARPGDYHPALLSSRAFEELCGWIERVVSARSGWMLSSHRLKMLRPLLTAVATEDRIEVFGIENRLSQRAHKFLTRYRERHM
jgi:hypothetical protein